MAYTGIVLAGGKSSRMGVDKTTLEYKGKMLAEWSVNILKPFCNEILVSSNNVTLMQLGYPIVADTFKDNGPMAGIVACLEKAQNEICLVIACDTPFVSPNIYEELIRHMEDYKIVMASDEQGRPQPLIACYSKKIIAFLHDQLKKRKNALWMLSDHQEAKLISFPSHMFSLNINKPSDLL